MRKCGGPFNCIYVYKAVRAYYHRSADVREATVRHRVYTPDAAKLPEELQ